MSKNVNRQHKETFQGHLGAARDLRMSVTENGCIVGHIVVLQFAYIFRLIWAVLVGSAIIIFIYLTVMNLITFYKHPKAVSIDLTYKTQLDFPAVTICNYNMHR